MVWSENCDAEIFEFVVLANPSSPLSDLKTVLCDGKICVGKEDIRFYSPYNVIYSAYSNKYNNGQMWGIGFRKAKITEWIENNGLKSSVYSNGIWQRRTVITNEIDLTYFNVKQNDFFLVLSNQKAMEEICFGDIIPNTKYRYWRCKGLNNVICKSKTDKEISDYLNKGYRFAYRNNIPIEKNDLFKSNPLIAPSKEVVLL